MFNQEQVCLCTICCAVQTTIQVETSLLLLYNVNTIIVVRIAFAVR